MSLGRIIPIISIAALFVCLFNPTAAAQASSQTNAATAIVLQTVKLPRTSLGIFMHDDTNWTRTARRDGLDALDLPSIGSGLARIGSNEFIGITDRGPNFTAKGRDGKERRVFPLPRFAPAIVRFKVAGDKIELHQVITLRGQDGKLLTGLSNGDGEEPCYESVKVKSPLPFDVGGVDPEGIRVLPDGRFLISEEYGPSLLVVNTNGIVQVRYTPEGKPLTGTPYPVKPILPRVLSQRRDNRGFESVALSADGKTAFVMLQSSAVGKPQKRFDHSRVSRVVRLDVSDPLNARVTGHFLMPLHAASDFAVSQKQTNVKLNDAEWIGPDKLLVLEQAKGEARLLVADFSKATNLMGRGDENTLAFEAVGNDLSKLPVNPARVEAWFSTAGIKAIDSDKLEGLAMLGPQEIALINDNDFGTGDNTSGQPSVLWIVRVNQPMP